MSQTVLTVSRDGFDWAGLIISALASIGAVGGFIWAIFLYKGELNRRRAAESDARMSQARLVTGWVTGADTTVVNAKSEVFLRNGSDQPVHDAVVCAQDRDGRIANWAIGVLPPNMTRDRLRGTDGQNPPPGMSVPTAFWFRDAAGRRWFRDWDGELRDWPADNSDPDWWSPMLAERRLHEGN